MGMFGNSASIVAGDSPVLERPIYFPGTQPQTPDVANAGVARPSFFGQGGVGRGIAGSIGDLLLQQAGARPVYQPMVQARQEAARQRAEEERRVAAAYSQFVAQQQYKRANPEPTDLEQRVAALNGIEPGLGGTYAHNYAANGGGQAPIIIPNADGTRSVYDRSTLTGGAAPALPTKPVGKLTPMSGGPTQPASGYFPLR